MSENLATILLAARRNPAERPAELPEIPGSNQAAYEVQALVQARMGAIGGWKVGAPTPTTFSCAPLPASHVMQSPARVTQAECPDRGVEAEIAVLLNQDLPPRETPYTHAEVLAAIASAHPAIELLQSRFQDVNAVDPLSALADSLSHYGLVWGPAIEGWQSIDLVSEGVAVMVNGTEVKRAAGNPAGEMIRLVAWLANEGARWAGGLKAGQVVTTGSWTGKDTVPADGTVRVVFDHCGQVEATYT